MERRIKALDFYRTKANISFNEIPVLTIIERMDGLMTAETEHQEDNPHPENNVRPQAGRPFDKDDGAAPRKEKSGTDQPTGFDARDGSKKTEDETGGDEKETDRGKSAEGGAEDPLAALADNLKQANAQKDELQNQLLRNMAEMENLRKRTHREISDSRQFAIASFARDLLSVADNLRRAINAAPQEKAEANSEELKNLLEGVCMTERELLSVLEKHNVRKTSAMGEKFDPNFHQAMFEIRNPEVPNNTVMEVVQEGYVIGERMLRPAMVGVSKGGPKNSERKENGSTMDDAATNNGA